MFLIYTIGVIIITAVSSNAIISRTLYKTEIQGFKDSKIVEAENNMKS